MKTAIASLLLILGTLCGSGQNTQYHPGSGHRHALITIEEAERIALHATAGKVVFKTLRSGNKQQRPTYLFGIQTGKQINQVVVDAQSGRVIRVKRTL